MLLSAGLAALSAWATRHSREGLQRNAHVTITRVCAGAGPREGLTVRQPVLPRRNNRRANSSACVEGVAYLLAQEPYSG